MKASLVGTLFLCCFLNANAQRFSSKINRLGLGADVTFLNLDSDNVDTFSQTGYAGYLETRGEFTGYFDMIYAISIFNHNIQFQEFSTTEKVDASLLGAEVKFLAAFRPFQNEYVTIEAGPGFMVHGEFDFEEGDESRLLGSTEPITIEELQKTNPVNINGIVGLSAGISNLRLTAHYHYAFLNALDGSTTTGENLEGRMSYVTAGLRVYF